VFLEYSGAIVKVVGKLGNEAKDMPEIKALN